VALAWGAWGWAGVGEGVARWDPKAVGQAEVVARWDPKAVGPAEVVAGHCWARVAGEVGATGVGAAVGAAQLPRKGWAAGKGGRAGLAVAVGAGLAVAVGAGLAEIGVMRGGREAPEVVGEGPASLRVAAERAP
jgi:hypothetical protein